MLGLEQKEAGGLVTRGLVSKRRQNVTAAIASRMPAQSIAKSISEGSRSATKNCRNSVVAAKARQMGSARSPRVLRLFPLLLSQASPSFSFKDCHFRLEKCKEATARIVVFKEFEIMNSFTLEATFYGADSFGLSTDDPIRKRSLEIEKLKR